MTNNTRELLEHEKYLLTRQKQINKLSKNISGNVHIKRLPTLQQYNLDPNKRILFIAANHWSLADFILSTNEFLKYNIEVPFTLGGTNLYKSFITKEFLGISLLPDLVKGGMIPVHRGQKTKIAKSNFKELYNTLDDIINKQGNIKVYDKQGRNKTGFIRPFQANIIKYILGQIKNSNDEWDLIIETSNYDEIPEIETLEKTIRLNKEKPPGYGMKVLKTDIQSLRYHSKNGAAENEVHLIYDNPISIKEILKSNKNNSQFASQEIISLVNEKQKNIIITPTSLISSMLMFYSPNVESGEMVTPKKANRFFFEFFNNITDKNQYSLFIQERINDPNRRYEIIDRGIFCLNKGKEGRFATQLGQGFDMVKPQYSKNKNMESDRNQVVEYYANQIPHITENIFNTEIFTEFDFELEKINKREESK
ncbi:hypothetical protein JXA48_03655 [Candidatus Woesearchaeota archaeon]|nr:hypothetical protein [Candidatus Woesearchaeota archaeon]